MQKEVDVLREKAYSALLNEAQRIPNKPQGRHVLFVRKSAWDELEKLFNNLEDVARLDNQVTTKKQRVAQRYRKPTVVYEPIAVEIETRTRSTKAATEFSAIDWYATIRTQTGHTKRIRLQGRQPLVVVGETPPPLYAYPQSA